MTFARRLRQSVADSGSPLCVGLDPDVVRFPTASEAERHCERVLDATLPHVCAVKPNLAFFEQHGAAGYAVLERLRARVPDDRLLILDAKRGDIGNTGQAYARALFDVLGADAVTANPLMGEDSMRPFLQRPGRGCFLLTRTSNPGADDLLTATLATGAPLFQRIVELALDWDREGSLGLVVGATDAGAVATVRATAPELPLLIPGVGVQGGSLEAAVDAGLDSSGGGVIVSVSRGISDAPEGPARAAAALAERLRAATQARIR